VPDADSLPAQRRLVQCGDDFVSAVLRDLDKREAVPDLNGAKLAGRDAGFSCNRADEIRRANTGLAARGDEQANEITLGTVRAGAPAVLNAEAPAVRSRDPHRRRHARA
jgi:hypothetical protein